MNSTRKPILLDLFSGAGGAAKGYQRAGFYVVGIDNRPQPHYCGDEFYQADALEYCREHGHEFDAIHASPPCQQYTKRNNHVKGLKERYPDLVDAVRTELIKQNKPFVIENVPGAPLRTLLVLCGSMFGLDIYRHRLFESNVFLPSLPCNHSIWTPNRFEGGRSVEHGTSKFLCRSTIDIGRWGIPTEIQKIAMQIDWMELDELSEAIPPAYTEYIGLQLRQFLCYNSPIKQEDRTNAKGTKG